MEKETVNIFRRESQKHLPKDMLLESSQGIGACFEESGEIASGLTLEEKKKLLPPVIGVDPNDVTFYARVKEYYASLTLKVPPAGITLDITRDKDGNPLNVSDYIKFRFAEVNPDVSLKEEIRPKSRFYIENPKEKLMEKKVKLGLRKDAYKEYIKISGSKEKTRMLMVNLGIFDPLMDEDEYEIALESKLNADPQAFLDVARDPNIETIAFINNCVSKEVLRKIGTTYLNGDETIGNTLEDAVAYMKNKANSETVATLKARLTQFEQV